MRKIEESPFTQSGKIKRPKGRQPLITELQKADRFLDYLDNIKPGALHDIVERVYEIAVRSDNEIVALRACEIALAYAIGRPTEVEHHTNQQVNITFVRAEPPTPRLLDENKS